MRTLLFGLIAAAGLCLAPFAHAGAPQPQPPAASHAGNAAQPPSHAGSPAQPPSHADPATKTLPKTASATAQHNAFGQQGARMRAAHAAAQAAAAAQARNAAAQHQAAAHGPNAHANAHAGNASSHAAAGLAHAAAARGGAGAGHSHH